MIRIPNHLSVLFSTLLLLQFAPSARPDTLGPLTAGAGAGTPSSGAINSTSAPGVAATYIDSEYGGVGDAYFNVGLFQPLTFVADGSGVTFAQAGGHFYFEVTGPDNVEVPVDIISDLVAAMTNYSGDQSTAGAYLEIFLPGDGGIVFDETVNAGNCDPCTLTVPSSAQIDIPSNTEMLVGMGASVVMEDYYQVHSENGTAVVDPYFSVDPAFLASNPGYSLEFSPGFSNVPVSTPEPSVIVTAALGLVGILAPRRLRKRVPKNHV